MADIITKSVNLNNNKSYDIKIGGGLLDNCGHEIYSLIKKLNYKIPSKFAVITDTNVEKLYLERCAKSFEDKAEIIKIIFPAGEQSKNLNTLSNILEQMAEAKLSRADWVIALGGGVAGDMAGFAAGCYMRGVKIIQVPTSLLAAVDSSVGGKTAVDLKYGKNLAGLFYQPSLVICDTDLLKTLPEIEYQCGMAEALKTGILSGEKLFKFFEDGTACENKDINEIIAQCVEYKAGVVERDEKEQGERKLLNLGHTIGHAIELCSDYKLKHGIAVAMGIKIIARASFKMGWCSDETLRRIENALIKNNLLHENNYNLAEIYNAAISDKKRSGDTITLVIPAKIGACELKEINVNELKDIIDLGL